MPSHTNGNEDGLTVEEANLGTVGGSEERETVAKRSRTLWKTEGWEPCCWPGQNAGTAAHLAESEGVDSGLGTCNVGGLCLSTLSRTTQQPLSN